MCSSPRRVKTLHVLQVSFMLRQRRLSPPHDETPMSLGACQRDRQPCCWLRAFKSQILKGMKCFAELKMNLLTSLKIGRQATCGNHPSAVALVVCAGKISLTPPSICHICTNLLFSGTNCSNWASLLWLLALKLPHLQLFQEELCYISRKVFQHPFNERKRVHRSSFLI